MATTKLNYGYSAVIPNSTTGTAMDKRSKEDIDLSMTMRRVTNKTSHNMTSMINNSIKDGKKNTSHIDKPNSSRYQTGSASMTLGVGAP